MQTYQNQQGMNQQPAPMGLSDQELAYDLLYQEKALMANISSEVVEGSHAGLRNVLNDMFMQIGQDQLQVFQIMNEQGWYQTKPAPQPELQTAKQKYQQMRQGLSGGADLPGWAETPGRVLRGRDEGDVTFFLEESNVFPARSAPARTGTAPGSAAAIPGWAPASGCPCASPR